MIRNSTPRAAALRDFRPLYDRYGSSTTDAVKAARSSTSALPRKRTNSRERRHVGFVPKPDLRTAANPRLFDHLVGASEQRRRDFEPKRLGGREIDDEIELSRLLDRDIARLGTAQNLVDIVGGAPVQVREVC